MRCVSGVLKQSCGSSSSYRIGVFITSGSDQCPGSCIIGVFPLACTARRCQRNQRTFNIWFLRTKTGLDTSGLPEQALGRSVDTLSGGSPRTSYLSVRLDWQRASPRLLLASSVRPCCLQRRKPSDHRSITPNARSRGRKESSENIKTKVRRTICCGSETRACPR